MGFIHHLLRNLRNRFLLREVCDGGDEREDFRGDVAIVRH